MARIVLVLVVCSVLMFAIVLQTPPQFLKSAVSAYASFVGDPKTHAVKVEKPAVRSGKARRTSPRPSPVATPPENVTDAIAQAAPVPTPTRSSQHRVRPYVFCVASNGTELYSLNSANGPVVIVLQRGEIVEPQLEINDAGRTWAFVTVTGQNLSGFLRRDSLERQQFGQTIE
jgi:hypothetical protein